MSEHTYHPLLDTLRLYAGWLLACLFVVQALGSYQELRHLPWNVFLLNEWVESPLILHVTFMAFLFLLLSGLHRLLGGGIWKGLALGAVGFLLLVAFQVNA